MSCCPLAHHRAQLQARRRGGGAGGGDGDWAGLQGDVDALVDYVDSLAAKRAQHAWHTERNGLLAKLGELEARAATQERELSQLRHLLPAADANAAAAGGGGGAAPQSAAAVLARELEVQRADAAGWRGRCQAEQRLRLLAEGAVADVLGVIDELLLHCDGISAKLAALDAASGAAAAKGRAWQRRRSEPGGRSLVSEAALVLLLVGCAVAVAIVVTRQVPLTRLAASPASG
ncbi:hypothetical protein MNEG_9043 [Monoraphidium neglectum]|uniref:Uncharacterized protein n=1 Tax=Monoraphidium neglectum TaxID=145388 RepID=A0A0D2JHU3_9CHLO|nr:hypothetical protein MNEG_9043 [Monoraphidium neglectum]KIY98922.1 hypothetical protein MNEG_9043 [Monoraphidium neglectum]|eukprot:XP_013897942.1 hypothetical protein MNEG_9043 [Monoraphidium neglectum]